MHSTPIAPPGLMRAGELEGAEVLRREALVLLSEGGFAEYFEPFTDEPLGRSVLDPFRGPRLARAR